MKAVTYTPHGALPDLRGFAPAIVAAEISKRLGFTRNLHVTAREAGLGEFDLHPELGEIPRRPDGSVLGTLREWGAVELVTALAGPPSLEMTNT